MFPIMDGPDIPWDIIAPFDKQARKNHGGQDLERLAQRGGLGVTEAIAVLHAEDWFSRYANKPRMPKETAILELIVLVKERSAGLREGPPAPPGHAGDAPATEPEWFPIETAPRDGSWFWVKRENPPPTTHIQESIFKWDDWYKGWFAGTGWYGKNQLGTMRFTHWRPFQEALAASQAGTAPREAVEDLIAFGDGEVTLALKNKDRDSHQFWQGWLGALQRVKGLAAHGAVPPQEQK